MKNLSLKHGTFAPLREFEFSSGNYENFANSVVIFVVLFILFTCLFSSHLFVFSRILRSTIVNFLSNLVEEPDQLKSWIIVSFSIEFTESSCFSAYSRRVDTFDDVSDTEDEPFVPVQYVKPIQRSMPKQGQIPLSARHKPLTDGTKSLEKPASGDQQPEPDTRPESPEPLHPMEEFNIAEAKRKEEKARVKAAEEEAKRQAEKEKEEKLAQDEVKEFPKPEVAAPRDPGIVGPPPPDEVPDIVLVEEKEEKNIEDLPWPDCIPKIESFAHFRREKLKVELEKQEKAAAERAAKGLPPLEYKEPTWGSDWSIMPPIEWAYDEKGEKYARFKQVNCKFTGENWKTK